jgi:hypothetical protein
MQVHGTLLGVFAMTFVFAFSARAGRDNMLDGTEFTTAPGSKCTCEKNWVTFGSGPPAASFRDIYDRKHTYCITESGDDTGDNQAFMPCKSGGGSGGTASSGPQKESLLEDFVVSSRAECVKAIGSVAADATAVRHEAKPVASAEEYCTQLFPVPERTDLALNPVLLVDYELSSVDDCEKKIANALAHAKNVRKYDGDKGFQAITNAPDYCKALFP